MIGFHALVCVFLVSSPQLNWGAEVINQILFYESKQSWTSRDFELFKQIKKETLNRPQLGKWSENDEEDFLLSRLSAHESALFEFSSNTFRLPEAKRVELLTRFSASEIDEELERFSKASFMVEIKESQLKQRLRFKSWLDVLKRKYKVKFKQRG